MDIEEKNLAIEAASAIRTIKSLVRLLSIEDLTKLEQEAWHSLETFELTQAGRLRREIRATWEALYDEKLARGGAPTRTPL